MRVQGTFFDRLVTAKRCRRARGFSLIEVMVVVVILSILAALAVFGVKRYIRSSKTTEAIHLIGEIKAGEEAYLDETFGYYGISGATAADFDTVYPNETTDYRVKVQWNPGSTMGQRFASIGVSPAAAVQYRYSVVAGRATDAVPTSFGRGGVTSSDYPTSMMGGAPWYFVKAIADLDGNGGGSCDTAGQCSVYLGSYWTNEIFSKYPDE